MRKHRRKYGDRDCCKLCGQDIEWHGRKHNWIDRGGNRSCVPYKYKGEIVTPPESAKHKPDALNQLIEDARDTLEYSMAQRVEVSND